VKKDWGRKNRAGLKRDKKRSDIERTSRVASSRDELSRQLCCEHAMGRDGENVSKNRWGTRGGITGLFSRPALGRRVGENLKDAGFHDPHN